MYNEHEIEDDGHGLRLWASLSFFSLMMAKSQK